jgi:hypothetical protein
VSVKKAKKKSKVTAKISAEKSTAKTKNQVDLVKVRENINNLVGVSAEKIAIEVIKVALTGQLAVAKYLFEAIGLYPATEQTAPTPVKGSLAHTLLTRMGLPTEPVICEEEEAAVVLANDVKGVKAEITTPSVENEAGAESEDGPERGQEL